MAGFNEEASNPPPPYSAFPSLPDENTPLQPAQISPLSIERPRALRRRCFTNWPRIIVKFIVTFILLGLFYFGLLYFNIWTPGHQPSPPSRPLPQPVELPVRIAIVGAGPAGIATAFQLSNEFEVDSDVGSFEVVVFEKKEAIGGRMVVDVDLNDMWFAQSRIATGDLAGGDLFADKSLMRERAEQYLGIDFEEDSEKGKEKESVEVGFFDGKQIVSKVMRPVSEMNLWQRMSLWWRYGRKVPGVMSKSAKTKEKLDKLLKLEDAFVDIKEMLEQVGIRKAVSTLARDSLKADGWSNLYTEEVVQQQVQRQFGQGTEEISDLALNIAIMREKHGLRVGGTLEDVLGQFLKKSRAELRLSTTVLDANYECASGQNKSGWRLELTNGTRTTELFDKVILAGPWNTTSEGYYRKVWTTFIATSATLKASHFGIDDDLKLPSQILVIDSPALAPELRGVREISYVKDLYGPDLGTQSVHKLYRVQSDKRISDDLIAYFGRNEAVRVAHVEIPYAYPLLFPRSEGLGKFKKGYGLYGTGDVEQIASSVDLSWVAGENVARLIKKEIDEEDEGIFDDNDSFVEGY